MKGKELIIGGLKTAGVISVCNLMVLGAMVVFGYGTYPVDPFDSTGSEMSALNFVIRTIVMGGLLPGLLGSIVWLKIHDRWKEKSSMIFTVFAMFVATIMTIPNSSSPTGDAFILTTVLHYTTAILGSLFIPHISITETSN